MRQKPGQVAERALRFQSAEGGRSPEVIVTGFPRWPLAKSTGATLRDPATAADFHSERGERWNFGIRF